MSEVSLIGNSWLLGSGYVRLSRIAKRLPGSESASVAIHFTSDFQEHLVPIQTFDERRNADETYSYICRCSDGIRRVVETRAPATGLHYRPRTGGDGGP
jgi:hypothetical protein